MIVWLFVLAAWAEPVCSPDSASDAEVHVVQLYVDYLAMDEAGFDKTAILLDTAVRCIDEVPPSGTISRIHQAQALIATFAGRQVAARRAMASARHHDPLWQPPSEGFPVGHPVQLLWQSASATSSTTELPQAVGLSWLVDGMRSTEAPTDRAFLLQRDDGTGPLSTEYVFDVVDFASRPAEASTASGPVLRVSALFVTRSRSVTQDTAQFLPEQQATSPGVGGKVGARYTPLDLLGAEVSGAAVSGSDPVMRGTVGVDVRALGLVGGRLPVGDWQFRFAGRFGGVRDTLIFWTEDEALLQHLRTMTGPTVGAEVQLAGDQSLVRALVDQSWVDGQAYSTSVEAVAAWVLSGPLAVEVGLQGRITHAPITASNRGGQVFAERSDQDARLHTGLGLWF